MEDLWVLCWTIFLNNKLLYKRTIQVALYMILPQQNQAVADYTTLKFSDEFNTDGAPDPAKWSYDLGTGSGVGVMAQTYTNSSDNVIVAGGNLKITAKKVGTGGTVSIEIRR
jgi:hypothetical protein